MLFSKKQESGQILAIVCNVSRKLLMQIQNYPSHLRKIWQNVWLNVLTLTLTLSTSLLLKSINLSSLGSL